MALQSAVIPGAAGNAWNGIATTCHFATTFRLYLAEFGIAPTALQLAAIGNFTALMTGMIQHGRRLTKPMFANLAATPGSVVIFVQGGNAFHSCIADAANTLGGYNQTNFFTSPGVYHGHSTHSTGHLVWDLRNRNVASNYNVLNNPMNFGPLVSVPESVARACLRAAA